jgi:hypothetical protein
LTTSSLERTTLDHDEDYDTAIKRIVDAAPPLSQAQRDRLATLLDDCAEEGAA